MKKKRTQWHPAFCSALKLELSQNKDDLIYQSEVGLNTKPIQLDLLVILKTKNVEIEKDIGAIFKGHNIFEYKSPKDSLDIDVFYKVIAYASLYKAYSKGVNEVKANDVTISFVRESKPVVLFKILESEGNCVEKRTEGIYYISGRFPFAIQVIVSKELNKKEYLWLTSLTERLSLEEAEEIVKEASKLSAKDDKEYSESVLQVVMSRNTDIFDKIKEVPTMFEALAQLMKPEIDKMIAEREAEATARVNAEKDAVIAQKEAENKKALEYIKELEAKLALAKV